MDLIAAKKLVLKHQAAEKALSTLGKAILSMKNVEKFVAVSESREEAINMLQDSLIQRFEYSFDSVWKYLKIYLEMELMVEVQVKSPAAIFREYLRIEFFTEEQIALAMEMLEDRNETVHTYYKELAAEICKVIPNYYNLMNLFLEKTTPVPLDTNV